MRCKEDLLRLRREMMKASVVLIALCASSVHAFIGVGVRPDGQTTIRSQSCTRELRMAGSGVATTRAGKGVTLDVVSSLLEKTTLLFSIPSARITANQIVAFRKGLPDGCTAKVVKNTLMRRASVGTAFDQVVDISRGENMWIFVEGEENLAAPINYITGFGKDNFDKDRAEWQQPIKMGIFSGDVLDTAGVTAIAKLPTKQELIQRLAIAINSVPTKLGKSIKLVPTKVGRVIKLAFADEGEGGDEASGGSEEAPAAAEESGGGDAEQAAPAAEAAPEGDAPAPSE